MMGKMRLVLIRLRPRVMVSYSYWGRMMTGMHMCWHVYMLYANILYIYADIWHVTFHRDTSKNALRVPSVVSALGNAPKCAQYKRARALVSLSPEV